MRLHLKRADYDDFVKKMITGELVIIKRYITLGTLYPKTVVRYPFFLDNVEHYVNTSQVKDRILLYARRNNLIFDEITPSNLIKGV